jgi:hypothetical protein
MTKITKCVIYSTTEDKTAAADSEASKVKNVMRLWIIHIMGATYQDWKRSQHMQL